MEDPSDPRMKYKVTGSGKPKRVSKGLWESKIGKRVEKAQGKQAGQGCPRGKWDIGAHKQCKKRPSEYTKSLGGK